MHDCCYCLRVRELELAWQRGSLLFSFFCAFLSNRVNDQKLSLWLRLLSLASFLLFFFQKKEKLFFLSFLAKSAELCQQSDSFFLFHMVPRNEEDPACKAFCDSLKRVKSEIKVKEACWNMLEFKSFTPCKGNAFVARTCKVRPFGALTFFLKNVLLLISL